MVDIDVRSSTGDFFPLRGFAIDTASRSGSAEQPTFRATFAERGRRPPAVDEEVEVVGELPSVGLPAGCRRLLVTSVGEETVAGEQVIVVCGRTIGEAA